MSPISPAASRARRAGTILIQLEGAAFGIRKLRSFRCRAEGVGADRWGADVIIVIVAGLRRTLTIQRRLRIGHCRRGCGRVIAQVGGVVTLHVIGVFRQACLRRRPTSLDDVAGVSRIGNRSEDRNDCRDDH
jgi:hypothetical protein